MNSAGSNQTISPFKSSDESIHILLPISIITIISSLLAVICALYLIFTIIFNRSLHTLSNVLTCNSVVGILLIATDICSISIYVVYCNFYSKHQTQMFARQFFCQLRGYVIHISFCSFSYSFVIQAFYRLVGVVYPSKQYYRRLKPYLYAISIQWMFSLIEVLPLVLTNSQVYIEHEFLCLIEMTNTRAVVYLCCVAYLLPLVLIVVQYGIIARHTRKRDVCSPHTHSIRHARRAMVLMRRILILIGTYLVVGIPHSSFILLEALSIRRAPSYAHRVGFMFMSIGTVCITLMMIHFTRHGQKRRQSIRSKQLNQILAKKQHSPTALLQKEESPLCHSINVSEPLSR